MDAADHNEGATEQAIRYIITRPCLAEGSLRLLKYLRPLFPEDGQVQLQDSRGELFPVTVEAKSGRLTGVGELYRAHNLGVNDVLHLRRAEDRRYLVECVVKPHARNQSITLERSAPVVTEKRVVIHATPHVREVRMERVTSPTVSTPEATSTQAQAMKAAEPVQLRSIESNAIPGQSVVAQPVADQHQFNQSRPEAQARTGPVAPVRVVNVRNVQGRPRVGQETAPTSRSAAPITSLTARLQQASAPAHLSVGLNAPIQITFPALNSRPPSVTISAPHFPEPVPPAFDATEGQTPAIQTALGESTPVRAVSPPPRPELPPVGPPAVGALTVRPLSPATQGTGLSHSAAHSKRPQLPAAKPAETSSQRNAEDQLTALARLTGYACEHLGSGVVRLQAELGAQSYSVLIATTPQALTTPAWSERCDYMALLTPEDQRPQGIPRFTYAALDALLEHARLAPLTPVDLRGYWNTGSFDQESVESVAELVSAHLAQRGSFSHVLLTLAQQPAHSLVHLPRLAERLGSGVNTAELQSILDTLSRPPFQALIPLPNGQYYLRSDVRDLLQEFGEYAEGMRRRIRPAPLAATGR